MLRASIRAVQAMLTRPESRHYENVMKTRSFELQITFIGAGTFVVVGRRGKPPGVHPEGNEKGE